MSRSRCARLGDGPDAVTVERAEDEEARVRVLRTRGGAPSSRGSRRGPATSSSRGAARRRSCGAASWAFVIAVSNLLREAHGAVLQVLLLGRLEGVPVDPRDVERQEDERHDRHDDERGEQSRHDPQTRNSSYTHPNSIVPRQRLRQSAATTSAADPRDADGARPPRAARRRARGGPPSCRRRGDAARARTSTGRGRGGRASSRTRAASASAAAGARPARATERRSAARRPHATASPCWSRWPDGGLERMPGRVPEVQRGAAAPSFRTDPRPRPRAFTAEAPEDGLGNGGGSRAAAELEPRHRAVEAGVEERRLHDLREAGPERALRQRREDGRVRDDEARRVECARPGSCPAAGRRPSCRRARCRRPRGASSAPGRRERRAARARRRGRRRRPPSRRRGRRLPRRGAGRGGPAPR